MPPQGAGCRRQEDVMVDRNKDNTFCLFVDDVQADLATGFCYFCCCCSYRRSDGYICTGDVSLMMRSCPVPSESEGTDQRVALARLVRTAIECFF